MAFNQILRLLDELNSSDRGSVIYRHISETFDHLESSRFKSDSDYIELFELLFDALAKIIDKDSPLQTEIHILKSTLVPALPGDELTRLNVKTRALLAHIDTHPANNPPQSIEQRAGPEQTRMRATPEQAQACEGHTARPSPAFNFHLNETRNNIQRIKNKLNDQLDAATERNSRLAKLMKDSMEAVRQIDSKEGISELRLNYMRRYIQLFKEHQDLATHFDDIRTRLNEIESNSQYLDEELTRVHQLGFTDELTQLPNRRALMQRLNDEITRVQRYGGSLALAIIDMDEFKPINDNFGHDVGDAVLKHFADTALSVFRHHDTVARYGGEEFAILMPNTELEGAMCALKKIQAQFGDSSCQINDNQEIENPTFSAGIALYSNGETTNSLIKRADTAMYRAKHSGKNRIEAHTMGVTSASHTSSA